MGHGGPVLWPEAASAPSALRETPATTARESAMISAASAKCQSPQRTQLFPGGCMSLVYKWAVTPHQSWVQLCVVFVTPFWNSLSLSATPSFLPSKATPGLEPLIQAAQPQLHWCWGKIDCLAHVSRLIALSCLSGTI